MFFPDFDECATNTSECDNNADCIDTDGSFTCSCRIGYTGDGMTCSSKLTLAFLLYIENGECVDPIGETYSCNCSAGYEENANVDPRTCKSV